MKWIIVLSVLAVFVNGANWAVLVAGSKGYQNYRHQADTCHAYHSLVNHGIPKSNIIHMSYDDVAHHSNNPIRGKLFNKPDKQGRGTDVYQGCQIDYKGSDVTPEVFLAVIKGNKSKASRYGNGRILQSTSSDKVFINFADHGAPGLIAFPRGQLYADQFIAALKKMHQNKMYKEMVIYIEACESGSMFENLLPKNWNIYATTAANSKESSWAAYCGSSANIGGTNINSCLGDLYSVNWMEDLDAANTKTETLQTQYKNVKSKTTKSHVMQFGDISIANEKIGQFQGKTSTEQEVSEIQASDLRMVKSYDANLEYLYTMYQTDPSAGEELQAEIRSRYITNQRFKRMSDQLFPNNPDQAKYAIESHTNPQDFDCLRYSIGYYETTCGELDDYVHKYLTFFNNICMWGSSPQTLLKNAIDSVCK